MLFILMMILFYDNDSAQERKYGLGVILGEPTGISGKLWKSENIAVDGAIAWSFEEENSIHFQGDYLFYNFSYFKVKEGKLPVYYGIGGRIKVKERSRMGVRFPFGLNYIFEKQPLEVFYEIAPILDLVPSTKFGLNSAVGVRYFFESDSKNSKK